MLRLVLTLSTALLPTLAQAHVGLGDAGGFSHGLMHPLSGIDHVLAMVAVGIVAAQLGGRALGLVPAAFLVTMIAGGALGAAGIPVPFVEIGIGLSVVVLGLVVAGDARLPVAAAAALVAVFAVFHGHAHGAEMPETASGLAYGLGFVAATALLHGAGIALGLVLGRAGSASSGRRVTRLAGGAMSIAGAAILTGVL